jgi:hypothetical protein
VDIFDGHSGILLRRWGADLFAMPHGFSMGGQTASETTTGSLKWRIR